jgi:hypothetical protein
LVQLGGTRAVAREDRHSSLHRLNETGERPDARGQTQVAVGNCPLQAVRHPAKRQCARVANQMAEFVMSFAAAPPGKRHHATALYVCD